MAEEETVAAAAAAAADTSPLSSDHKRKLEDLDSEAAPKPEISSPPSAETPAEQTGDAITDVAENGVQKEEEISNSSPDVKRPRIEEEINGSGNKIRFWDDKWCGTRTFVDEFPILAKATVERDITIDRCYFSSNGRVVWAPRYWNLKDVEIDEYTSLMSWLESIVPKSLEK